MFAGLVSFRAKMNIRQRLACRLGPSCRSPTPVVERSHYNQVRSNSDQITVS
jgi:hypothetical protein